MKGVFLPYQIRWLDDHSRIKIWEKSRRIGATWVQAYEDVRDCVKRTVPCVWFSSADLSAAREYILYCAHWAKVMNAAFSVRGEMVLDEKRGISCQVIEFVNGARINALSSNPTAFRSKGGKVVIDEFAFHQNDGALWAAAKPVVTWGYPLRIISTHNGKGSLYYKFIEAVQSGDLHWGLHRTTIFDAVNDGLVDKIMGRATTQQERDSWIAAEKSTCARDDVWEQEYCANPIDESTAFITYELLDKSRRPLMLNDYSAVTDPLYIGVDIARKKDMTVIWGVADRCGMLTTVIYIELANQKFIQQEEVLYRILSMPMVRRACMDSTGIGLQMTEGAQEHFGKQRVEAVYFTAASKEVMAYQVKNALENNQLIIPDIEAVRADFHSIRKEVTAAGNIRFDAKRNSDGHADRFWACALAVHAAKSGDTPTKVYSRKKRGTTFTDFSMGGLVGY